MERNFIVLFKKILKYFDKNIGVKCRILYNRVSESRRPER